MLGVNSVSGVVAAPCSWLCYFDCEESMDKDLQKKMQDLMYRLTKEAARTSYRDVLENCGISEEDYEKIKDIWGEKLGIVPYC